MRLSHHIPIFTALITCSFLFGGYACGRTTQVAQAGSFSGAYLAGRVAGGDQHMEIAVDYFKQALAYQPKNVMGLQDLLLTTLSLGDIKSALPVAQKLKNNPAIERFARLTLAADAIRRRNYRGAKSELQFRNPSDMDRLAATLLNAWIDYGRGYKSAAIAQMTNLRGPLWYDLFLSYHLALINELAGRKGEAESYFNRALSDQAGGAAAPDTYERVIVAYASFLIKQKRRDEALRVLKDGEIILSGRSALKIMRLGVADGGMIDFSIKTPQQGASEVFYDLGTAINRDGTESFARIYIQMGLSLDPDNDIALYQLADIFNKLNNPTKAIETYEKIPQKSAYYRDAHVRLALTLLEKKQQDRAIAELVALRKLFPQDHGVLIVLSSAYMQNKDFAGAQFVMQQAISALSTPKKSDWAVFYQSGICLERLNQWDKAEAAFRKALELRPDEPEVLNYLGYSLIDRNRNLDEALDMVKKAAAFRPNDGFIVDSLGWAYYKLRRYSEAANVLEKAVLLQPMDPTINDHLGDAYWRTGRKLEATFQWRHAIDGKPEPDELKTLQAKLKHGLDNVTDSSDGSTKAVDQTSAKE